MSGTSLLPGDVMLTSMLPNTDEETISLQIP